MGDRNPGIGGRGDSARHPGNDLERDPGARQGLSLLAAPSEDERIAALQANDDIGRLGRLDKRGVDLVLTHGNAPRRLAHIDESRLVTAATDEALRPEPVMEDDVGGLE